jgi:uncharacterized ferredoxin-like protein
MVVIDSKDAEIEAVLAAAKLMVASARTAPKSVHGHDIIAASIVLGEEKEKLANKMDEIFTSQPNRERDFSIESNNVRNADAVVLIGAKMEEAQSMRLVDLGIAIGSAVKTASILNIDNRVFGSIGRAATDLKLIDANSAYGIPLSVRGSNIFFDRYDPIKKAWQKKLPPRE